MALFKILKGQASNLGKESIRNGYCYVTLDDHKMYIDHVDTDNDGKEISNSSIRFCLNAEVADRLSTARTITLSGDASGSVNFDGSQDINLVVDIEELDNIKEAIEVLETKKPDLEEVNEQIQNLNNKFEEYLPLTAGPNKKISGPLGLTAEIMYGPDLPLEENSFEGQLFFLEDNGVALPNGGTAGQVLIKNSDKNGDAIWADIDTITVDLDNTNIGPPNNINADTLDGRPASDYALKSDIGGTGSGVGKAGEVEGAEVFNCHEDAEYEETYNDRVYTWTVYANSASGKYSHAEGASSLASGRTSHAEGESTVAAGMAAHAEGVGTFATGDAAHAEGGWTEASGPYSHAEGSDTLASGWVSHAEGSYTIASEHGSHAEGQETEASGLASHAEGQFTKAAGDFSHAEGEYTVASSYAQHAQGSCNIEDASQEYLHIVGNGTPGYQIPSNAHTLDWIGNAVFAGTVSAPGADYAEHFEWLDGNPDNEDRVGMIVTLEGDKIRPATAEDEILGVVSGTAMVIGDNAEWEWQGKFLTDDYGRVITEKVEEFVEIKDPKTGEVIDKKSVGFIKRRKLNPEWDATKEYTRRSDRHEWDVVGLFGKLHVTDDGTCVPNGWATVGEDGKATASATKTNMRVMKRITDNIVLVFMK